MNDKHRSEAEWQAALSANEFRICRGKGTEPAFSGEYWDCHQAGTYVCRCCGTPLFRSETKYDSGSGWPSFSAPADAAAIAEHRDLSHGMIRTEITCAACAAHLGHVFPDGPRPTGLRFCVNSASLKLKSDDPST